MNFSFLLITTFLFLCLTIHESFGICGDKICNADEDCNSCAQDCISSSSECGNGVCEAGESCINCSQDCNSEYVDMVRGLFCCYGGTNDDIPDDAEQHAVSCEDMRCGMQVQKCNPKKVTYCCGDGKCEGNETLQNCGIDGCTCGNGVCDDGENTDDCPIDCKCELNSVCDEWETVKACPLDCHCGNFLCQKELGETMENCPMDCTGGCDD